MLKLGERWVCNQLWKSAFLHPRMKSSCGHAGWLLPSPHHHWKINMQNTKPCSSGSVDVAAPMVAFPSFECSRQWLLHSKSCCRHTFKAQFKAVYLNMRKKSSAGSGYYLFQVPSDWKQGTMTYLTVLKQADWEAAAAVWSSAHLHIHLYRRSLQAERLAIYLCFEVLKYFHCLEELGRGSLSTWRNWAWAGEAKQFFSFADRCWYRASSNLAVFIYFYISSNYVQCKPAFWLTKQQSIG